MPTLLNGEITTPGHLEDAKPRKSFADIPSVWDYPDFLNVQLKVFHDFVQDDVPPEDREDEGLQAVFNEHFPIHDSRERYTLEFIHYALDPPKHSVTECIAQGLTYSVPLNATLRLSSKEEDGDEEAFRRLVERHQDRIFGYLMGMVKDRAVANDIFQDTFVRVINAMQDPDGAYSHEGKWLSWVMSIARNAAIDHMRKAGEELPDLFFEIFVVDESFKPVGSVPVSKLMRNKREVKISDIMTPPQAVIRPDRDQEEVAVRRTVFEHVRVVGPELFDGGLDRLREQLLVEFLGLVVLDAEVTHLSRR